MECPCGCLSKTQLQAWLISTKVSTPEVCVGSKLSPFSFCLEMLFFFSSGCDTAVPSPIVTIRLEYAYCVLCFTRGRTPVAKYVWTHCVPRCVQVCFIIFENMLGMTVKESVCTRGILFGTSLLVFFSLRNYQQPFRLLRLQVLWPCMGTRSVWLPKAVNVPSEIFALVACQCP